MKFLKKYKIEIFIALGILAFYFFSRLYRIETLPLFTDEAIYTRWSQIARYDASWRFISLTDGKQPLFVWLDMNFMRFIKDPLLAGRYVSVLAGFLSLIGVYFLAKEAFTNRWVGIIASIFYLVYPMGLVYDRMALYDSLVFTFTVWALYFEILLVKYLRLDIALVLGMILGGAVLTKTSAFFFIYLLPFVFLLFDFKKGKKVFFKLLGLSSISVFLAYFYYSILRLSPFFHIIKQKDSIFVYPISEWINHPFLFFFGNLKGQIDWLQNYLSWPIIILIILGVLISFKKFYREKIILCLWFLLPFFALALFGKVLYPRFILFMTMPLIILASFSLYFLLAKIKIFYLKVFITLILFSFILRSDFFIITDFARAPIPYSDLGQYINGWPAGGGLKEIISFLEKESQKGKIYVVSEGTFGSLPTYGVEIYLGDNKNIGKEGIWPLPDKIPDHLLKKAQSMNVYLIFNASQVYDESRNILQRNWPIKFIAKYQKGISDSHMSLYQVLPK